MLFRFAVTNHLSIREEQELSLVGSTIKDSDEGLISSRFTASGTVLPCVVIYGANASGKSNFVDALGLMCAAVLRSHSGGTPGGGTPRRAFALDSFGKKPTAIEVDFEVDGDRYLYGFELDSTVIVAEWLYQLPTGTRRKLFERKRDTYTFGRFLKGRNRTISDLTRDNSLFLSAAIQNNHDQLGVVGKFFASITAWDARSIDQIDASFLLSDDEPDQRVLSFLEEVGTGVVGYRWKKEKETSKNKRFRKKIISLLESETKSKIDPKVFERATRRKLELGHKASKDRTVYFDLDRESDGTNRLLPLLSAAFKALDSGTVLIADEINTSLHTLACEAVIGLFCSQKTNPHGAQLIATTHDTNLLRSPVLRRDQLWFTEKDDVGATHLFPLTDISTRKGDNIARGYLQGRYGAIPFSGQPPSPV